MTTDIIMSILAAVATIVGSGVFELIKTILRPTVDGQKNYTERLSSLIKKLEDGSKEVDDVLREIALVAKERQDTISKLEENLNTLEGKEKTLRERIEVLEKTPVKAADHFAELISAGERRNAKRDYILFGAGVLVTTTIAILIQLFAR